MSEPQPENWEQFIDWSEHSYDWSKGDLLDACYDPMLEGMDQDSRPGGSRPGAGGFSATSSIGTTQPPNPSSPNVSATSSMCSTELPKLENNKKKPHESGAACADCGDVFRAVSSWFVNYQLNTHAKISGHLSWACATSGCLKAFSTHRERDAHQKRPHIAGHGRLDTLTPYDCVECGRSSTSKANLLRHAKELQHQPYACECGSSFSRLDVLNRHLEKFDLEDPKYPCKYCRRHRGPNGFRRLDHLRQHIRNYHHHEVENDSRDDIDTSRLVNHFPTCHHPDCPSYRDDTFKLLSRKVQQLEKPFATQSAFTKHMREQHNECTYPCDVSGCDRIGQRGYFREKDLLKHRREHHPGAAMYEVTKRDLRVQCLEGCGAFLAPSSLKYHDCQRRLRLADGF